MQEIITMDIDGTDIHHFLYEEIGVQGVGKNHLPTINMDKYVDTSMYKELHTECLAGLAKCQSSYKMGMFIGAVPESEGVSWTSILYEIEKYDPDNIHMPVIKKFLSEGDIPSVYRYIYFAMGAVIPWFFGLYLHTNDFHRKTSGGEILPIMNEFPLLIEYMKTLPFKEIGRVMFFCSYPDAGCKIHRDANMVNHKDHCINFYFGETTRPSFIWDEKTKQKIYIAPGSNSYFFNNRDYHGVDPEPGFKYTLRIDGTFTDEMCEELGLVDGYVWHEDY